MPFLRSSLLLVANTPPPSVAVLSLKKVARGVASDDKGPLAFLSPSITTPQHAVGAFLALLFLVHSWPMFKVSLLEVAGFKMFQGTLGS